MTIRQVTSFDPVLLGSAKYSTAVTLLTHTHRSHLQTMGYEGVWHMRVSKKKII